MNGTDENDQNGRSRWIPVAAAVAVLACLSLGLVTLGRQPAATTTLEPIAIEPVPKSRVAPEAPPAARAPVFDSRLSRAADAKPRSSDTLSCLIEPHELVDIGSSVAGVLEKVHVQRGQHVKAGQVLAQLDADVERAAVEVARARAEMKSEVRAAEARVDLGDRKRDRAHELVKHNALSNQIGEEIETEAELAQRELERTRDLQHLATLQLQQAREVLQRRTIRSPLDGVVVDRMMTAGERVEDEPILKLAQIDPLRVEVILPAARFGSVQPAMRASVQPEIPGDELHVAEVTVVDPIIDAASGTFRVQLDLPNRDGKIPGGLHCDIRFLEPDGG